MYLSITTTHKPATDLGYLLHKNPAKVQTFRHSFGVAHVFYPVATQTLCTAILLLDIDPIGLVRRKGAGNEFALAQYVNDRPYVASSFLSVALGDVYRSALAGRSVDRPDLADMPIPLEATIGVLPSRGGEGVLRRLFAPLGYDIQLEQLALDETYPDWGESRYFTVTLRNTCCLKDLLAHLYVLIPVLDNDKHYWVGDEEIEKLLRHGEGWLAAHPEKEQIARRYLKNKTSLAREALARLAEGAEGEEEPEEILVGADFRGQHETELEEKISLNQRRIQSVLEVLIDADVASVIDLGCGEGKLLYEMAQLRKLTSVAGMDVSIRALEYAKERLNWDRLSAKQQERLKLFQGSLIYRDQRLNSFDAATVIEVIEHMDLPRLAVFGRILFEFARPKLIIITTPNSEYNVKFENLPAGQFRHADHRFEWTRTEFQAWAQVQAERYGYQVSFRPVGEADIALGAPTQMGVFERHE